MEDNPQEHLEHSIIYGDNCIEFIKHQDHHFWIYFNGAKTDAIIPRHLDFHKRMKVVKIYKKIWYGKSIHNKKRITSFFADVIPEHFL